MSNELHQMTQDLQTRIRELAYLMWESAGRQQGMAIEYWLKAESEVLSALQAAARMLPGGTTAKSTKTEPEPRPSVGAPAITVEPAPAAPAAPAAPVTAPATPDTKAVVRPPTGVTPAGKPAAHKVAARGKTKT
jgi:Protein of unknown function (DUF2934)